MCMCTHTHVHVCTHMHAHAHTHTRVHTRTCTHTHTLAIWVVRGGPMIHYTHVTCTLLVCFPVTVSVHNEYHMIQGRQSISFNTCSKTTFPISHAQILVFQQCSYLKIAGFSELDKITKISIQKIVHCAQMLSVQ